MSYPKLKPKRDLSGKKYGRLLVIKSTNKSKNGNIVWECVCDCGNIKEVSSSNLISGNTKSCGCLQKERQKESIKLPDGEASFNRLLHSYIMNCKKINREFLLTKEDFRRLTKSNCHYCGIKPLQVIKEYSYTSEYIYNGIDRIDSTKGYTLDNCVTCCKTCNIAKHKMTQQEFYNWIIKVYNHIS